MFFLFNKKKCVYLVIPSHFIFLTLTIYALERLNNSGKISLVDYLLDHNAFLKTFPVKGLLKIHRVTKKSPPDRHRTC